MGPQIADWGSQFVRNVGREIREPDEGLVQPGQHGIERGDQLQQLFGHWLKGDALLQRPSRHCGSRACYLFNRA